MTDPTPGLVAVLPGRDLDMSQAFYARLGFACEDGEAAYRLLAHPDGGGCT